LSEGCVFAHNLFLDCPVVFHADERVTPYYKPHSTEVAGKKEISPCDGRWFNNIFFKHGLESMKEMPGFKSDSNVFLGGAQKGAYDAHSLVLAEGGFWLSEIPTGVKLVSSVPAGVLDRDYPRVTHDLIGDVSLVGVGIETQDGKPVSIDADMLGKPRPAGRQVPGPFGGLKTGANEVIVWQMK
jgi:alpha-N-arabinofuranosidase